MKCYPVLCPYLSKKPDNFPSLGNDIGVSVPHPPNTLAYGKIDKEIDVGDTWIVDLDVPCFEGECDQYYLEQLALGKKAVPPPAGLDGQVFGCDLWVEVTKIY